MKNKLVLVLVLVLCFSSWVQASESSEDDEVWNMSLGDILDLDISVASVKPESISSTPAVVSLYRSDDLQSMGFRSLHEFLSFVPGFVAETDFTLGVSTVMIRGTTSQWGDKVLILLNGVPYWSSTHGHTPIFGLTFETIDRIEVIRGPGAVIYGSNAISGVVNIITRSEDESVRINNSIGPNSTVNSTGMMTKEMAFDDAVLSFGYEFEQSKGFDVTYFNPEAAAGEPFSNTVLKKRKTDNASMFAQLAAKDYNFLLHIFENTTSGSLSAADFADTEMDHEAILFSADYKWRFDEFSYLKFYSQYNKYAQAQSNLSLFALAYEDEGKDNYRGTFGSQFNYVLNDDLTFLSGVEVERRATDDYYRLPDELIATAQIINEYSLYAQFDYSVNNFRFLLGARAINNEAAGDDVNPRLSAVYNISESQSIKLLYSVGFTSPVFTNRDLFLPPIIVGSPDIIAEKISTIDLAYTHAEGGQLFVANVYYYEGEDFIKRAINDAGLASFDNSGSFDRIGFELDYQTKFDNWTIFANLSYNDEGNEEIEDDDEAFFVPQYTSNIGVSHRMDQHKFGGALQYISERADSEDNLNLNLNYSYLTESTEWYVTFTNVLNDDMLAPDAVNAEAFLSNRAYGQTSYQVGVKLFWR
ncbi:MAG: TonB-dependent receptor [Pseudomonadota bacterium]